MTPTHRDKKPHSTAVGRETAPDPREDAPERDERDPRDRRIGATQLAAPSTRRWRRAGRFDQAS